jgi:hypothetical protein
MKKSKEKSYFLKISMNIKKNNNSSKRHSKRNAYLLKLTHPRINDEAICN